MAKRAPLTEAELEIVKNLDKLFTSSGQVFCCGGNTRVSVDRPCIFYAKSPQNMSQKSNEDKTRLDAGILDLTSEEIDLAAFHDIAIPASFGKGAKSVYDESYRLARELSPAAFNLNFDPLTLNKSSIISTISAVIDNPIRAELYKLNSYGPGGMFGAHQDTPRGDGHLGTLVVCIPTMFEGGEFIVRHRGQEIVFDWSSKSKVWSQEGNSVAWAFFYSDVEHEIKPVTSGHRITISYHIYANGEEGSSGRGAKVIDPTSLPFCKTFVDAFENPNFLPNGGRLAIGLDHEYAINDGYWTSSFAAYLKGVDAEFWSVFNGLELDIEMVAVYKDDDYFLEEYHEENGTTQPEKIDERDFEHDHEVYLVSEDFSGYDGDADDDKMQLQALINQGARIDQNLVWVSRPREWVQTHTWMTYGNEPTEASSYVAAALVVTIPAANTPARATRVATNQ